MKNIPRIVYALALVGALSGVRAAFADGTHEHFHGRGFWFGICVGQNLTQQGVTLPAWQPGKGPNQYSAYSAQLKLAKAACKPQKSAIPASGGGITTGSGSSAATPSNAPAQ